MMNVSSSNRQNVTVLVMEDKTKLQSMAVLLQTMGTSYDFQFCSDYQRALTILDNDTIDLILLTNFSIEPAVINVFQFFQHIKSHYPVILLVDDQDNNRLDKYSFEHENIIDCILKPIQPERIKLAFHKFRRFQNAKPASNPADYIFIKMGRILRKFHFYDILYIQATGALSTIYTPTNAYIVNENISQLEYRLPKHKFSRIHKSYLVGLDHVVGYEKRNALLENTKLPIGATYRVKLESIFCLFNG